jgi:lipoate---protein ligase
MLLRRSLSSSSPAVEVVRAPKLRVIDSSMRNPFWNIALEEYLFESRAELDDETELLYLWRNEPSVIIGRNQNPFKECNVHALEADNVHLARRHSGGGAVYQDLGNTIFTFLSPVRFYSKERNYSILCDALARGFGVRDVHVQGRNDLAVGDRKVSGSAFKLDSRRAIHHGTLLVDVDMGRLGRYLHPSKAKLKAKGVASVRARVMNLIDAERSVAEPPLNHATLCDAIVEQFAGGDVDVERWDEARCRSIAALAAKAERLGDWQWRFGETPPFEHHLEHRFEWGTVDVHIDAVKSGIITGDRVKIFSDSLHPELIDELAEALRNVAYDAASIGQCLERARQRAEQRRAPYADHIQQFSEWLQRVI